MTMGLVSIWRYEFEVVKEPPPPTSAPSVETPSTNVPTMNIPTVVIPQYDSWESFFKAAEIPDMFIMPYTSIVAAHNLDVKKVRDLDYAFLTTIGIQLPEHQLKIMSKVRK